MKLEEIKKRGVYKTTLNVEFREKKELLPVSFFIRVYELHDKCVSVIFLNDPDNAIHYLLPSQIDTIQ